MAPKMKVVSDLPRTGTPGSGRWLAPWPDVVAFLDETASTEPEKWVLVLEDVSPSLVTHLRKGRNVNVDPSVYEAAFRTTQRDPKRGTLYMRRRP